MQVRSRTVLIPPSPSPLGSIVLGEDETRQILIERRESRICSIMPSRRSKGGLLARVNFPLYTVQMVTDKYILVGGGGGSSKTGVANGFVSLQIF